MHEPTDTSVPTDRALTIESAGPIEAANTQAWWLHVTELISKVVKKSVLEALEEHDQKRKREAVSANDKRRRNTKLLLSRYHLLKLHCEQAVFDSEAALDDYRLSGAEYYDMMTQLLSKWDTKVQSIETSAARTAIILNHVDRILKSYQARCLTSKSEFEQRKWRVIEARYLTDPHVPTKQIAQNEFVDERTIYRDIDTAIDDLSVMLWGIEGLIVNGN